MAQHTTLMVIDCETREQADTVIAERLYYEEDYGFTYGLSDVTPARVLTIYFVGETREAAIESLPFDSYESAESYQRDEGGNIYSAPAYVGPINDQH